MPKTFSKSFFTAHALADALNVSQKSIHRLAKREGWPSRTRGYRVEYAVPRQVWQACRGLPPATSILYQPARIRELKRAVAIFGYVRQMQRNPQRGTEWALEATVKDFQHLMRFSTSALRQWISGIERGGLAALHEHKAGRVGRKSGRLERILR